MGKKMIQPFKATDTLMNINKHKDKDVFLYGHEHTDNFTDENGYFFLLSYKCVKLVKKNDE